MQVRRQVVKRWFKTRKQKEKELEAKKREFLTTLKYGSDLDAQWKEHQRLEQERREAWQVVEQSEIYKAYDKLKKEEREVELSVLDSIRREHDLPLCEDRRWNDGMIIVYDSIVEKPCDDSPIGWCATFTPEGGSLHVDRDCLFCGKKI